MKLKEIRSIELRSKINIESLENKSIRLLFQDRLLEKMNGIGVKEEIRSTKLGRK